MSNQADHTIVRLRVPPELKQKIEESAEKNNRSQSAEMVARLEQSFIPSKTNEQILEYMESAQRVMSGMDKQQEITHKMLELVLSQIENLTPDQMEIKKHIEEIKNSKK